MPDVRLIDANALKKDARKLIDCNVEDGTERYFRINAVEVAAINAAPTIDAVPVVRCKDCKFSEAFPINRYCLMWNNLVSKKGFCYKGAKMDGGAE